MTKKLVRIALIAAMYAGLALLLKPISFGVVQFRLSESLVIMPLFMFEGVWGVTIGCMLANIASPFGIIDIVLGSAITLVSGLLTRVLRKKPLIAMFPPVILNALFLPLIWYIWAGDIGYWTNFCSIFISQFFTIYVLGLPLFYALKRTKIFNDTLLPKK